VPDDWIDRVFAVMALAPQHAFQVLTKRAKRMREYLTGNDRQSRIAARGFFMDGGDFTPRWPLPHVWLGVSAEDQARADERIPHLLATPAAVRFVSAEPLLSPLDLTAISWGGDFICGSTDALRGIDTCLEFPGEPRPSRGKIDWVIVGGETGPAARPMPAKWVRCSQNAPCWARGEAPGFSYQPTPGFRR
jgi:protein gp37